MPEFETQSSAIADLEYDAERERLVVTFVSGRIYEYVDVPFHVAAAFERAPSKGTYFNIYIRDRYDFREVTAVAPPSRKTARHDMAPDRHKA